MHAHIKNKYIETTLHLSIFCTFFWPATGDSSDNSADKAITFCTFNFLHIGSIEHILIIIK